MKPGDAACELNDRACKLAAADGENGLNRLNCEAWWCKPVLNDASPGARASTATGWDDAGDEEDAEDEDGEQFRNH